MMEVDACVTGNALEAKEIRAVGFSNRVPIRQVKEATRAMVSTEDRRTLAQPVPVKSPGEHAVHSNGDVFSNRKESTNNDCYMSILNGCLETEKEATVICG